MFTIDLNSNRRMERPFFLHDGIGYGCCWLNGTDARGRRTQAKVVFDATFQNLYSDQEIEGHKLLEELPFTLELAGTPTPDTYLSAEGYHAHVINKKPLPSYAEVFSDVVRNLDAFIAFHDASGTQQEQTEMLAAYVVSTYLINEFHAASYLWFGGERGSGKTQASIAASKMASMGVFTQGTSTFASLRETAALGGLIFCDDFENWRGFEPDKKNMFLSGTTRGASISLRRQGQREGDWVTEHVPVYCPKGFSAISSPDDVLASRSIFVELRRSDDGERTGRSPTNVADWPVDPMLVRDWLWLHTVQLLPKVESVRKDIEGRIDLSGRDRDNLLPLLTVARLVELSSGRDGLVDRLLDLAKRNADQRESLMPPSENEVLIRCLQSLMTTRNAGPIPTSDIRGAFVRYCENQDISEHSYLEISPMRIGQMLSRLGFNPSASHRNRRSWMISETDVRKACVDQGIVFPEADDAEVEQLAPSSTIFEIWKTDAHYDSASNIASKPAAPWD
ncbi:hypothetical protein [Labrenzia sp. VG12]|uniref:hypothetical protein n=1 Tax=Labrenzia sp. VG12 TaxID=2021862 RepID=UPI000B8BFBAB|nr:hypothetical protein [Labrenzia sp. VG12]ASP35470.1 hypothetical protein CHH27_21320 [Labrenzia sp. VG12]